MTTFIQIDPDIRALRLAACDLNGVPRGKRVPVSAADKSLQDGTRFPLSVLNLDIWGNDIHGSPLVLASGDQDGALRATERGFVPVPWLPTPTALLPIWMFHEDGTPFAGDPRHALATCERRFTNIGLQPVVALELEFHLVDDSGDDLQAPVSPRSGNRCQGGEILSLQALDRFDAFFTELYDACEAMGIPADTAISESGLGQYELNLQHQPSALKAADDAWLFKMLVKGLARKHAFAATFMAKPYPDQSGSGMHMHFSVLDSKGRNIFDDGGPNGTREMRHAIAGCLNALPACTLVFAPHANSYDRFVPGAHAPTSICWAYENRTAALRVPSGVPQARRIEHRFAGGDANPYLLIAAVLGAAFTGLQDGVVPGPAITGNAYDQDLPQTPETWAKAIDQFDTDPLALRIFGQTLIDNLVLTKRQEIHLMADLSQAEQMRVYLDSV
ncbi:MAG: glutamine synthetase family protein [Paracoccaceae bacterium]